MTRTRSAWLKSSIRAGCRTAGVEARPLKDADLTRPDSGAATTTNVDELRRRGTRAADDLRRLAERLSEALVANAAPRARGLLSALALFGLREAIPMTAFAGASAADLVEQARGVERVLRRRICDLDDAAAGFDREHASPTATLDHELARMAIVFGGDFRVLPQLRPANVDELARSFGASVDLQGGDQFAAIGLMTRMARLRAAVDRLDNVLVYGEALGAGAPPLQVGQLPFESGDRWSALPPAGRRVPARRRVVVPRLHARPVQMTAAVAGLWIDEWVEIVPEPHVTTGIAFNFDEPGAPSAADGPARRAGGWCGVVGHHRRGDHRPRDARPGAAARRRS